MKFVNTISKQVCSIIIPIVDPYFVKYAPVLRGTIRNMIVDSPQKRQGRPTIYPYTHTAKILQFPYRYYFINGWVLKYYFITIFVAIPIFHKISKIVNSPSNKEHWKKIREEWYGPHNGEH